MPVNPFERWSRKLLEAEARKRGARDPEVLSQAELVKLILRDAPRATQKGLRSARRLVGTLLDVANAALPKSREYRPPTAAEPHWRPQAERPAPSFRPPTWPEATARSEADSGAGAAAEQPTTGADAERREAHASDNQRREASASDNQRRDARAADNQRREASASDSQRREASASDSQRSESSLVGAPGPEQPTSWTGTAEASSGASSWTPSGERSDAPSWAPTSEQTVEPSWAPSQAAAAPSSWTPSGQPPGKSPSWNATAGGAAIRDDDSRIEHTRRGADALELRWRVSELGAARARALLGAPGELAIRVVSVRADPTAVVRSDVTEHGPVERAGEWTTKLGGADVHCVSAVGLRNEGRFVSIAHGRSQPEP